MRLSVNGRFYAARPTGVQRVANEVVRGLAGREGIELTLHLPAGASPPDAVGREAAVVPGLLRGPAWELIELPYRRRGGPAANGNGGLPRAHVSLDPANAGPVVGGPRVMLLHDVFPLTNPEWYGSAFRLWFRTAVGRAARSATRIVMFSEWARDEAVRELELDAARITVAPQGVAPFDGPPPAPLVEGTLARLGLEPGFVLAPGSGDPRKNAGFLREVFRLWRGRDPHAPPLVMAGAPIPHVHAASPGPDPEGVRRVGFVSDEELWALYAAASAFCLPSLAEGFGRSPLEAMASGVPVIVADYGCAREVLGDAATILPLDAGTWVDALAGIVSESAADRRQRVEAGRARAGAFRWEDTVEAVLGACRAALAEAGGNGRLGGGER